jgi:predicted nucleic acid-binding Zn ribbon protein
MAEDIDTEIPERCPRLTPSTHCKKIENVPRKRKRTFKIIIGIPNVKLKVVHLNQN